MKSAMNLMGNMRKQDLGMRILLKPLPCGLEELNDLINLLNVE
jgi:hypothetical protein